MPAHERKKFFLREWRLFRGLTQPQLGELSGKTKSQISELETGNQRYNQDILELMAKVLNCEPADLISRDPNDPESPWRTWEKIPNAERARARRVLESFAEEFEHDRTPPPPKRRRREN